MGKIQSMILSVMYKGQYLAPEQIRDYIKAKYGKMYYVDTISREIRKLKNKGLAVDGWFERNGSRYKKWKKGK